MFSGALKSLRKAKKLNQAALAKQFGVTQAAIATWESGKRQPDFETLCRIADYFNVTTDRLLGRTPMDASAKPETPPPPFDADTRQPQSSLDDAPQDAR